MWNFQNFYHILRGETSVSDEVFNELLKKNSAKLTAGLADEKFEKSNVKAERANLKSDGRLTDSTGESVGNFLEILAENLNVSLMLAYEIFSSYLFTSFLSSEEIEKICKDDRSKFSIFNEIADFYRTEQIYLLRCIAEILKSLQMEETPIFSNLKKFVEDKLSDIVTTLLEQYSLVVNGDLFPLKQLRNSKNSEQLSAWSSHSVDLQIIITEILVWHFHVTEHTSQDIIKCISLFKRNDFGLNQPLRRFNWQTVDSLIPTLNKLQLLFVMRIMEVDSFVANFIQNGPDNSWKHDWLEGKKLGNLEETLELSVAKTRQVLGPVYLSWAVLLQLVLTTQPHSSSDDKVEKIRKLGYLAQEYDAVEVLLEMFADPFFKENEDLRKLACSVVYSVLDGFLCFFDAQSLCSVQAFDSLLSEILSEELLAEDLWNRDFSSGIAQYLRDTLYKFPLYFDGCMKLLTSLCRASKPSCQKVVAMLQRLPCYSEDASYVSAAELGEEGTDSDSLFRLMCDRFPYGTASDAIRIPANTVGHVLVSVDDDTRYVQWRCFFNGWQVCLLEVQQFDNSSHNANVGNVLSVYRLLDAALETDAQIAEKFVHFLNSALHIISRYNGDDSSSLELKVACLNCIAGAAKNYPAEILNQLSGVDILPSFTSMDVGVTDRQIRDGLIGVVLKETERETGEYNLTLAFLRLLENCLSNVQSFEHPSFMASMVFVMRRMFPVYQKWKYIDASTKDEIGSRILNIVHSVLQQSAMAKKSSSESAWDVCRHELTFGEARSSIIGLVSVGPVVLKYITQHPSGPKEERAIKMILRSLSVLSQLLDLDESRDDIGLIFQEMRSLAADQQCDQPVAALAKYLLYSSDTRLPKLALVCLRKFARRFPVSILSCLGNWADVVCQVFVQRLQSTLEDVQLKIYCLDFVSVCVDTQPALAEKLFGAETNFGKENNELSGALECLVEILTSEEQVPQLLLAAYRLLLALWKRRHRTAIERLTSMEFFWPNVCGPLLAGENNYYLRIIALLLQMVAQEIYWCHTKNLPLPEELKSTFVESDLLASNRLRLLYRKLGDLLLSQMEEKQKLELLICCRDFIGVLGTSIGEDMLTDANNRSLWVELHIQLFAKLCTRLSLTLEKEFSIIRCYGQLLVSFKDCWFQSLESWDTVGKCLLETTEILNENLPSHLIPACVEFLASTTMFVVNHSVEYNDLKDLLPRYLNCWLHLMEKQLSLHFNVHVPPDSAAYNLLITSSNLSVCLVEKLVKILEPAEWLISIKKTALLRSLVALIERQKSQGQFNARFCQVTCGLFSNVIGCAEVFESVQSSGFIEFCCIDLTAQIWPSNDVTKNQLFQRVLVSFTIGLDKLNHKFLPSALNLVGSYSDIICYILNDAVQPDAEPYSLQSGRRSIEFLLSLSKYQRQWKFELPDVFERIMSCISSCCLSLINCLSKPNLLQTKLRKSRSFSEISNDSGDTNISGTSTSPDPATSTVRKRMLELLQFFLVFLRSFAPELVQVSSDETFDAQSFDLILDLQLSTNISSKDQKLSFGSLLLCVQLCVSALRKVESAARSSSPAAHRHGVSFLAMSDKSLLNTVLESAIELLLAETALYIRHPSVSVRDRAALKREVVTELNQLLMRCFRYAGGSPSRPSTPGRSPSSHQSPSMTAFDQKYIKFAYDFIQDLSHSS